MINDTPRAPSSAARSRSATIQRLTRDLWRALSPSLMPDPRRPGWAERYLLEACEAALTRLAADPRSEPMAARGLFRSARTLMGADQQFRAARVIEAHMARARARFEHDRGALGLSGAQPRCAALNRKGKPCGREPLWGTPFCISHTPRAAAS
jgi:hypothetical protein